MLFYFFGFTAFSIFVNSKIQTTVLAWHDMFAHVLESDLLYYNLTTLLQPVLWSYAEDLDLYLPRSTWASLQVGKNIIPIFTHPKFIQFARFFSSWNFKYRYLKILFSLKLKSIKTTQSKFCICHIIDSNQLHFYKLQFCLFQPFGHVWGSSAWKGADGPAKFSSNPFHYIRNHESWTNQFTAVYEDFEVVEVWLLLCFFLTLWRQSELVINTSFYQHNVELTRVLEKIWKFAENRHREGITVCSGRG